MISEIEITKGAIVPKEYRDNFMKLLKAVNDFRQAYGKPMVVSSGMRTKGRQLDIYRAKAKKKEYPFLDGVFDEKKVPMGSAHITCEACDFADPSGDIDKFCVSNRELLEKCGLYVEHPTYTIGWCHLQVKAPKSGKRFFIP